MESEYQTNVLIWDTDDWLLFLLVSQRQNSFKPPNKTKVRSRDKHDDGFFNKNSITAITKNEQPALSSGNDQRVSTAFTQYLLKRSWWRFL